MLQTPKSVAAVIAALFPKSHKAVSEALGTEAYNEFAAEAQEAQTKLDAAQGDPAPAAALSKANADLKQAQDELTTANATLKETQEKLTASEGNLTTANAALDKANNDLTAANKLNGELKAKADQWDAYQASLKGAGMGEDSTNGKGGKNGPGGLSQKDQQALEEKQRLARLYPDSMSALGVTLTEE